MWLRGGPLSPAKVTRSPFGTTPQGERAEIFTIHNARGLTVRATNYGGIIISVIASDRNGRMGDIVLGYDTLEGYLGDSRYFGAVIGRVAGRIRGAAFALDGQTYHLAGNAGQHHLHGGVRGFNRVVWRATPFERETSAGIELTHTSLDREEGYPGTLNAAVTYTLDDGNQLAVDYVATTDKATPVNLTQHSYFNLAREAAGNILGHLLQIHADAVLPLTEELLPTGAIMPVERGPFDFRKPRAIGERIRANQEQLRLAHGYDHYFVLNREAAGLAHAARLVEPVLGRTLDLYTTEPGVQFYSGNWLDGGDVGKNGRAYPIHAGLSLETQRYPDAPNRSEFPSIILRPGSEYRSRTVFAFGIAD